MRPHNPLRRYALSLCRSIEARLDSETDDSSEDTTNGRGREVDRLIARTDVSVDALRVEREEFSRAIDRRFQVLNGFNEKAVRIIELNGIVLTIIVTGATIIENLSRYTTYLTIAAVVLFLVSIGLAFRAFQNVTIQRSTGTANTVFQWERPIGEREHAVWYLKQIYPEWTDQLDPVIERRGKLVNWSLWAFIIGICAFLIGVVFGDIVAVVRNVILE